MLCSVREAGQGLVEYTFLLLLLAVAVLLTLFYLGPVIGVAFSKLNSKLASY
jgi:Flp pilus assembly pilin Flp